MSDAKIPEKIDLNISAEIALKRLELVEESLRKTLDRIARLERANERVPGAVSQNKIDELKLKAKAQELAVKHAEVAWKYITARAVPEEHIFIDVPVDPFTFERLERDFPDQVFRVIRPNKEEGYLIAPWMWREYVDGELDERYKSRLT